MGINVQVGFQRNPFCEVAAGRVISQHPLSKSPRITRITSLKIRAIREIE